MEEEGIKIKNDWVAISIVTFGFLLLADGAVFFLHPMYQAFKIDGLAGMLFGVAILLTIFGPYRIIRRRDLP